MIEQYTLVDLEKERLDGHKWIFGPFKSENSSEFTNAIEIGYINLQQVEQTDRLHFHSNSDEYYFILSGHMQIKVGESIVEMSEYQLLRVRPNVPHLILGVQPDTRILLIKAPPSLNDKTIIS